MSLSNRLDTNEAKKQNGLFFKTITSFLLKFDTIFALIVICLILTLSSNHFLTFGNFTNILQQVSVIGIIAIGMTFVISTAEIDLSVGSVVALSGAIVGVLSSTLGLNIFLSIIIALITGFIVGLLIGTLSF